MIEFELRDYQEEGIQETVKHRRILIPLPGGTGKSCIPLIAAQRLGTQTITILCSGNALYTWVRQINLHLPWLAPYLWVLDKTDKRKRKHNTSDIQYQKTSSPLIFNDPRAYVVIAKARSFQHDWQHINVAPQMLILDEPQKYLRNKDSKTTQAITEFAANCLQVVVTTGSPVGKGRQQFWPILHMLQPKQFSSYWRFVDQFCIVHRGFFGLEIKGARNTEQFREKTRNVIFRPSHEITGLPEILRDTIPVEMQPQQEQLYKQMQEQMYMYLNSGELVVASNTLVKITRMRQLLCCPKILDPSLSEYGAGLEAILDHIGEDVEERQHCIIATPFTAAIPFIREALHREGYTKQVVFQHGMTTDDLKECEEFYRANPKSVAICSIAFAQSYELETGNPVYFLGYSFDPEDNKQMEWRARRLTTERQFINAYYIQNLGTYDDHHLNMLSDKVINTKPDYNDMHALMLQFTGNKNP